MFKNFFVYNAGPAHKTSTNLFEFMFVKLNYNRLKYDKRKRKNGAKKLKGTKAEIYVNRGPPEGIQMKGT